MKNENEFDQFFKTGLSDPEIPFNRLDWDKMASLLDSQKKKRVVPLWVYTISGIAAALVIVMLWFLTDKSQVTPVKSIENAKNAVKPSEPVHHQNPRDFIAQNKKQLKISAKPLRIYSSQIKPESVDTTINATKQMVAVNDITMPSQNTETVVVVSAKEEVSLKSVNSNSKTPLSLTLIVAPDISSVSSGLHSKLSSNIGVLANYSFSKKLSVTTGIVYAKKYYNYAGINKGLYGNADKPWEVDADCDVLDIPLNLNYKLFNQKNISISVNTGLSSYLMLKEKYRYINQDQNGTKISTLVVDNKNQHLFGVANFSVNFEHQVSQKFSVGVQPFYKIPLTGIGYHNSNLDSKGVAFSLTLTPFRP